MCVCLCVWEGGGGGGGGGMHTHTPHTLTLHIHSQGYGYGQPVSMEPPSMDLIVLGLEWTVTTEDLKLYFEKFGEITSAEVKSDAWTDSPVQSLWLLLSPVGKSSMFRSCAN